MTVLNRSANEVGAVFKLETVEGVVYRFQNFFRENGGIFLFEGEEYSFLGIDYNSPEKNVTMDNPENQVIFPAIPAIINILEANNYFINAILEAYIILYGFPTVPVIAADKAVISSYAIQDGGENAKGGVSLNIQAPDNAVNARFPNTYYFSGTAAAGLTLTGFLPSVPVSNNVSFR